MKIFLIIISAVLLASIFYNGCSSSVIDMNSKTEFPQGRNLYVSKCSGCHRLFNPEKFDSLGWSSALLKMQPKAKITDIQKNEILLFLTERQGKQ
ncbi:MAG: hypothetical protein ACM3RX_03540 [Methanococcaceae archaeon]